MNTTRNEDARVIQLSAQEASRVDGGLSYGELPTLEFNTQEIMLASFYEVKDQPRTLKVAIP